MFPWHETPAFGNLEIVRDTSLVRVVRDEMLRLILSGDLAAGARINEPDVATRLRVSRVPVREALRELESSGLVASRKNVGTFVRVLAPDEIAELYDLRAVLDGHAARRAAELPDATRLTLAKRIASLVREMKACARRVDAQAYYVRNLAFHWALIEVVDSARLEQTYRGIVQQLHVSRLSNVSRHAGMRVSTEEHERIVDALTDGDAARCRELAEGHVSTAHQRLVAKSESIPTSTSATTTGRTRAPARRR